MALIFIDAGGKKIAKHTNKNTWQIYVASYSGVNCIDVPISSAEQLLSEITTTEEYSDE